MMSDLISNFAFIIDWINSAGFLGVISYILIFIFFTIVLFLPAWLMAAIGGYIFGALYGSIIISIAGIIGATMAFLIARYIMRAWVYKRLSSTRYFTALIDGISEKGTWIVFWLRLSSVIPFAPLSYMFGITNVKAKNFILASWIGMLPGTILYVYLGSMAKSINDISKTDHGFSNIFSIVGFVSVSVAVGVIARSARKSLKNISGEKLSE